MAEWICKKRFSVPDVVLGGIEINVGDRFADVEWNRHDHFNIPKIHTVFRWINPSCDPESDESDVPYFIGIHPDDVNKLLRRNNGEDVGKSIEKHYCTKCIHGILCESGELKCNHEAWTTTKDGTYAYPNGLRQIKSRDKPSWCPGFKAMQENKPNVNTKENANEETECQSKPYQIDSVKKQLDRIKLNLDNKINRYGESVVYRNAIDYVDMIDREYGLSWAMGNALWKILIAVMYKDESDEMPYDDMERVMRIRLAADELETILDERQICEVKQSQDKENKK